MNPPSDVPGPLAPPTTSSNLTDLPVDDAVEPSTACTDDESGACAMLRRHDRPGVIDFKVSRAAASAPRCRRRSRNFSALDVNTRRSCFTVESADAAACFRSICTLSTPMVGTVSPTPGNCIRKNPGKFCTPEFSPGWGPTPGRKNQAKLCTPEFSPGWPSKLSSPSPHASNSRGRGPENEASCQSTAFTS